MTNVLISRNLPHPDKQVTPAKRSRANGKTRPGVVGYDKLPVGACPRCEQMRPQTAWVDVMVGTAVGHQRVCQSCADQAASPKASDPVDTGKTLARYRLDYRRHGEVLTPVIRFLWRWHEYGGEAWKAWHYHVLRLRLLLVWVTLHQQTRGGEVVDFATAAEAIKARRAMAQLSQKPSKHAAGRTKRAASAEQKRRKDKRKAAQAARRRNRAKGKRREAAA